jgi:hypothetical protein
MNLVILLVVSLCGGTTQPRRERRKSFHFGILPWARAKVIPTDSQEEIDTIVPVFLPGQLVEQPSVPSVSTSGRTTPSDVTQAEVWQRETSSATPVQKFIGADMATIFDYVTRPEWSLNDPLVESPRTVPYGPYWHRPMELLPARLISGPLDPGLATVDLVNPAIAFTETAAVYKISGPPGMGPAVIKYQLYCGGDLAFDPVEPMLLEGFFLAMLEDDPGITHKMIYMSGPVSPFPRVLNSRFLKLPKSTCSSSAPGVIRYMVSEQVGQSLRDYCSSSFSPRLSPLNAFKLTAQMVMLLQRLHKRGILHGDAHWGNIAFSKPGATDLILIDFGRARVIDLDGLKLDALGMEPQMAGMEGVTNEILEREMLVHVFATKWETYFSVPSFREDIGRVLQTLPFLLYGKRYHDSLKRLCNLDPDYDDTLLEEYYKYKHSRNVFDTTIKYRKNDRPTDRLTRDDFFLDDVFSSDIVDGIRASLAKILHLTRSTKINEYPKYNDIIHELIHIVGLLEGTPSIDTGRSIKDIVQIDSL